MLLNEGAKENERKNKEVCYASDTLLDCRWNLSSN